MVFLAMSFQTPANRNQRKEKGRKFLRYELQCVLPMPFQTPININKNKRERKARIKANLKVDGIDD